MTILDFGYCAMRVHSSVIFATDLSTIQLR